MVKERVIEKQRLLQLDSTDRNYCGYKRVPLKFVGKVYVIISIADVSRENLRVYVVPEESSVTPALLGRNILSKFGILLTLPTEESTWREIMNINAFEDESRVVDGLQINSVIPYETKIKLEQIIQELYVDYLRLTKSKTGAKLKLHLDNPQPFHCTPRKLAYDEK